MNDLDKAREYISNKAKVIGFDIEYSSKFSKNESKFISHMKVSKGNLSVECNLGIYRSMDELVKGNYLCYVKIHFDAICHQLLDTLLLRSIR